jgi:hypothetical protein
MLIYLKTYVYLDYIFICLVILSILTFLNYHQEKNQREIFNKKEKKE